MGKTFTAYILSHETVSTQLRGAIRVKLDTGHSTYIGHEIVVEKLRLQLAEIGLPYIPSLPVEKLLELATTLKVPLTFIYTTHELPSRDAWAWEIQLVNPKE